MTWKRIKAAARRVSEAPHGPMMSVLTTQHNSLWLHHGLIIPIARSFFKGGNMGSRADVLCSEKSGGVGSFALGTAFAFPAGPGAGLETASPREPPCREPQRIYLYCNGEGDTLCTNDRGTRSCTPLPLLFCPRFGAGKICRIFPPPPPRSPCTLTMEHIIMISSLTLKQSIVIVDFQSCVDLRGLRPFGKARRSKSKRRDYGERRPSQ